MTTAAQWFAQGKTRDLWQKYCGFLDLDLDGFMRIQERLLMEQLEWYGGCRLGQQLLGTRAISSVEEFQDRVSYTTYADYAPYLLERDTEVLPEEPHLWIRTSGRSGEYPMKWVPVFEQTWRTKPGPSTLGAFIIAAGGGRGDFALEPGDNILYFMGPPPLGLGCLVHSLVEEFPFELIPPAEEAEVLAFDQRIRRSFELAMAEGIDTFFGISSILAGIGEQFAEGSGQKRSLRTLLDPRVAWRVLRGVVRSKLAGRPMYPKDLWDVKAILTMGMDTDIYRDKIEEYWGVQPLELYGGTEIWWVAHQTWDRTSMTFIPDNCFLEFISQDERDKEAADPSYVPRAVTLAEVKEGGRYEIVVTNFGGVFVRYRVGDMVEITGLRNATAQIELPQMRFYSRCDDLIDVAGFTRLTERVIWESIEEAGVSYRDWTARKEVDSGESVLRLYLEPRKPGADPGALQESIHAVLAKKDRDYRDLEEMTGRMALRLTLLSPGTFAAYLEDRKAAGVEVAHLKPTHVNARDEVVQRLTEISSGLDP